MGIPLGHAHGLVTKDVLERVEIDLAGTDQP
jgi:hypothetical protein